METYTSSEKDELSLITHVAVEPANVSDVHGLIPAIESTQQRGPAAGRCRHALWQRQKQSRGRGAGG